MWPKTTTYWMDCSTLCASIPFTWCLPEVHERFMQFEFGVDSFLVGGPAVKLMPHYFADTPPFIAVQIGNDYPGAMQRVNPLATKTTVGCVNRCRFCAVPITEGKLIELND